METTKRIVILLVLGLLAVGPGQSAEEPARRISNTRTASCLVKITCDPAILPLNLEIIDYLLRSSGVGGEAALETLQLSTDEVHDLFTIEYVQLLTSDAHGGVPPVPSRSGSRPGAPPTSSRRGQASGSGNMDEYMYEMMMEEEYFSPLGESSPSARSRSSSSRTRSVGGTTRTMRTAPIFRRTPPPTSTSSADGRTYLFNLNIHLPEEVKPAAKEFMKALVDNVRSALFDAYDTYVEELQSLLQFTEDRRDRAQTQLAKATEQVEAIKVTPPIELNPTDAAVHEQLEQIVDLSVLTQTMTFEDVIVELENSVDPPLQIQPNWKDLLEMAELEPVTPSMMDALTGVKLRKALEVLLAGVSGDFAEVVYVVDEGVIVIATEDTLPKKMVSRVYDIPALVHSVGNARSLVHAIQESIEPDSWFDLSDIGEGTIGVYMGSKLAIRQTRDVHLKIHEFLQSMTTDIPASTPPQIPTEMLLGEKRNLFREMQGVEMEIARLQARQSAIERQIVETEIQIAKKLDRDPVSAELQQLIEIHASQLAVMETQRTGRHPATEFVDIKEKLTRAKIELAQRHEQLSKSAGGDQLTKYNNELADKTIEFAEKTAALRVLNEQLGQTEQQLVTATVVDPQASRIRMATRAFEIADQRVDELNTRSATLQPPVVSMLGGR